MKGLRCRRDTRPRLFFSFVFYFHLTTASGGCGNYEPYRSGTKQEVAQTSIPTSFWRGEKTRRAQIPTSVPYLSAPSLLFLNMFSLRLWFHESVSPPELKQQRREKKIIGLVFVHLFGVCSGISARLWMELQNHVQAGNWATKNVGVCFFMSLHMHVLLSNNGFLWKWRMDSTKVEIWLSDESWRHLVLVKISVVLQLLMTPLRL